MAEENIKCDSNLNEDQNTQKENIIQEGLAKIILTPNKNVFYNPVQEFNRDLSIFVLNAYSAMFHESLGKEELYKSFKLGEKQTDGLKILEALSASGLRSIRYGKEIKGINNIIANDISSLAYENIQKNITFNGMNEIVTASNKDAMELMYLNKMKFNVIDLDPYGCPTQFLDSAVQSLTDGGLLIVTCTDMAVLAGNTPETCRSKYGSVSIKHRACHEMALRIALQSIETHANRYGKFIKPLLSVSADFYIRVFVTIHTSPIECKGSAFKMGYVHSCVNCETTLLQPLVDKILSKNGHTKYVPSKTVIGEKCKFCESRYQMGGPIWINPIHDSNFLQRLYTSLNNLETNNWTLNTLKRIHGMLEVIYEEIDSPLYYTLPKLCSVFHCTTPPMMQIRSALLHLNYQVSLSHCNATSIKTNAPPDVIWAIMQEWTKLNPPSEKRLTECAKNILKKSYQEFVINFDIHPKANPKSRKYGSTRFQKNPMRFWGPGTRHKSGIQQNQKSKQKQGKKRTIIIQTNASSTSTSTSTSTSSLELSPSSLIPTKNPKLLN